MESTLLTTQEAATKMAAAGLHYSAEDIAELARRSVFPGAKKVAGLWKIPAEDIDNFIWQRKRRRKLRWLSLGSITAIFLFIFALISALSDWFQLSSRFFQTPTVVASLGDTSPTLRPIEVTIPSATSTLVPSTPTFPKPSITPAPSTTPSPTPSEPAFYVSFAASYDESTGKFIGGGTEFPKGISSVVTILDYYVPQDTLLICFFYRDGTKTENVIKGPISVPLASGKGVNISTLSWAGTGGLPKGKYDFVCFVNEKPVAGGGMEVK